MQSELELPQLVSLKFLDPARDLDTNAVESVRLVTDSKHVAAFDIPLVISASDAKRAVDDLAVEFWRQRLTKKISLPIKYLGLDAGDVFHVKRAGNVLSPRWRIRRIGLRADGVIEGEAQPHIHHWGQGSPSPADSGASSVLAQVLPVVSNTTMQLFDIPLLTDETPDTNGFYAAGHSVDNGNKWNGWWLYRALDGSSYSRLDRFDVSVIAGSCVTALADGPTDYPDRKNTVQVQFASTGTPVTVTNEDLQRSSNPVICGASGRWEIMQFRDAALVSGTKYDLSHLIRGRMGTEHNTGNHVAGDKFFVISKTNTKRVEQELSLLNAPITYKPVSYFKLVASATAKTFVNTGEALTPYSGVLGSAVKASGDWTITWTRRNRQFGGWNNGGDVPMTEASEHYEADVKKVGGSVAGMITVSTPTITYTSAQQVTDFGATQASVTMDVFQLSQRVGRGNVLTITGQI